MLAAASLKDSIKGSHAYKENTNSLLVVDGEAKLI